MKKVVYIWMLLATLLSNAQDSCLPRYELPVKKTTLPGGGSMAYVEQGKGPVILFIHGLGGNLSHWQKNITELSKQFHCIAVDLPSYGYSDQLTADSGRNQLEAYEAMIMAFLQKKGLGQVILAGHSMGGQISLMLALDHPALVSRLVLLAPAGLETFTESEARLMTGFTPASFFEKQDEAMIRNSFRQNFYRQPADAEQLIQERIYMKGCPNFKNYTRAVSNGVRGMLQHPVRNELEKIKQPVLVLFGANDALIPNKLLHPALTRETLLKEALSQMPNVTTVIIPDCGHLIQFEQPAITNTSIQTFLQSSFNQNH